LSTPQTQLLYLDFLDLVSKTTESLPRSNFQVPTKPRQECVMSIFGEQSLFKLANAKVLQVGANGLGMEILKV